MTYGLRWRLEGLGLIGAAAAVLVGVRLGQAPAVSAAVTIAAPQQEGSRGSLAPLPAIEVAPDAPRLGGNATSGVDPLPALDVMSDAPRLEAGSAAVAALADNSFCYVCHANYKPETLAQRHAIGGIGCVDCHGDSFAHRNDENHTTPPDIMFAANRIDRACRECHESHDVPARSLITRFLDRCPDKTEVSSIVCTDCHGSHRLEKRMVRWDKQTGQLITADSAQGSPNGP